MSEWRWQAQVAILARTSMDKKSARSLDRYGKRLHRMLDEMVPWMRSSKTSDLLRRKRMEKDGGLQTEQEEGWKRALAMSMAAGMAMQGGAELPAS